MRLLYKKYYQSLKRGFTEKEFRKECEKIAGTSLQEVFEYASTVKAINYSKYFAMAGLAIDSKTFALTRMPNPNLLQASIYKSWMGE